MHIPLRPGVDFGPQTRQPADKRVAEEEFGQFRGEWVPRIVRHGNLVVDGE